MSEKEGTLIRRFKVVVNRNILTRTLGLNLQVSLIIEDLDTDFHVDNIQRKEFKSQSTLTIQIAKPDELQKLMLLLGRGCLVFKLRQLQNK